MVQARFKEHGEERKQYLRLSNVGKPLRQLWYDLKGFKGEVLSPETKLKFMYGDLIEQLFLFLAAEAGHEVTHQQEKVEFDGVQGSIDCIVDGVLIDVKSCSSHSFEKFQNGSLLYDDPFGYIAQLTGYKQALGIERAVFVAIDKVSGKICLFELTDEVSKKYNLSKKIKEVREVLSKDIPPKRCYEPKPVSKTDKTGNLVLATGCSYCSHKMECFKDSNNGKGLQVRFYSSGPKFFVDLKKEPRLKNDNQEEGNSFETFPTRN